MFMELVASYQVYDDKSSQVTSLTVLDTADSIKYVYVKYKIDKNPLMEDTCCSTVTMY